MTHKPKPNGAGDLIPPFKPSDEELDEFLAKCVKAGISKARMFQLMDQMWPEDEIVEQQTNV